MGTLTNSEELDFGTSGKNSVNIDEMFDSIPSAAVKEETKPWEQDPVCKEIFDLIAEGFEYDIMLIPGTYTYSPLVAHANWAKWKSVEDIWNAYIENSKKNGIEPKASAVRSLALMCGPASDNTVILELDDANWSKQFASAVKKYLNMSLNDCVAYKSRNKKLPHVCFRIEEGYDAEELRQGVADIAGKPLLLPSFAKYQDGDKEHEGMSYRDSNRLAFCYRWDDNGKQQISHNPNVSIMDPPVIDFRSQLIPLLADLVQLDERKSAPVQHDIYSDSTFNDKPEPERKIISHINMDPGPLLELCDSNKELSEPRKIVTPKRTYWDYARIGSKNKLAVRVLDSTDSQMAIMFIYSSDGAMDDLRSYAAPCRNNKDNLFVTSAGVIKQDVYEGDYKKMLVEEGKKIGVELNNIPVDVKESIRDEMAISLFNTEAIDMDFAFKASPPQVKKITEILNSLNPLVGNFTHFITAQALVGAIIGKKVCGYNMGRTYYPSLWISCMLPTGSNKSGIAAMRTAFIDFVNHADMDDASACANVKPLGAGFTTAALFREVGAVVDWKELNKEDDDGKERLKNMARKRLEEQKARLIICDELTFSIASNLSTGAPGKINHKELQTLLYLADNDGSMEDSTKQDGWRTVWKPALSIIGYTQTQSWQDTFEKNEYRNAGMLGRFIPVVNDKFKGIKLQSLNEDQDSLMLRLRSELELINNSIKDLDSKLIFAQGKKSDRKYVDTVLDELLEEDHIVASFRSMMRSDYDLYCSKCIVAAIRLTLMHAALDPGIASDNRPDQSVFKTYLRESIYCYYGYLLSTSATSEEQKMMEKMYIRLAKEKGKRLAVSILRRQGYRRGSRDLSTDDIRSILIELSELGIVNLHYKTDKEYFKDIVSASWTGKALDWSKDGAS